MRYQYFSRRSFLEFVGAIASTSAFAKNFSFAGKDLKLKLPQHLPASTADELLLTKDLTFYIIAKSGDPINKLGDRLGSDTDFTSFMPLSELEGFLFVNHETAHPVFVCGLSKGEKFSKAAAEKYLQEVGCSVLKLARKTKADPWMLDLESIHNRRISGLTPIPVVGTRAISTSVNVMGTLANCSGGQTPWRTFLTCEENYQDLWGEVDGGVTPWLDARPFFPEARPEHYGWVVEVDPFTGNARKLTAMGRFAHEGARVIEAQDGRPVVYMGDDTAGQCIYKFVGEFPGSLATGSLYAADTLTGRWLLLDHLKNPRLRGIFKDQMDLLIHTRSAAKMAGATPQDRPEGIDIHPVTGAIIVSLTNNTENHNLFGSLLKIEEKNGDFTSLEFTASTLLLGGPESGLACPDNLRFDRKGNLWATCDISDKAIGSKPYESFGHNSLFFIPTDGRSAGTPIRIASAPKDAEFTGPSFTSDGRTLFLSVQHPGNTTTDIAKPTSHWPEGGRSLPKSAVVALQGPLLDEWTAV